MNIYIYIYIYILRTTECCDKHMNECMQGSRVGKTQTGPKYG